MPSGVYKRSEAVKEQLRENFRKGNEMEKKRLNSFDYFEKLDTPEKDYWFGFLIADGWVNKREYKDGARRLPRLGIELQEKDGYILERLKKVIGSGSLLERKPRQAFFIRGKRWISQNGAMSYIVQSQKIYDDLIKNGFRERKTGSEKLYLEKSKYPWSRLLGFFDGDGTISFNKKINIKHFGFYGHKDLLIEISNFIKKETGFSGRIKDCESEFLLRYRDQQSIVEIGKRMYQTKTPFLKRKRKIYDEINKKARGIMDIKYKGLMRRKKLLIGVVSFLLTFLSFVGIAKSWVGSDPCAWITRLGTGTTSAALDGETVTVPFTVFGRCYNSAQGIDDLKLYLIEDTDTDTVIDAGELTNIELLRTKPDVNLDIDNIKLTSRYFMDSSKVTEGNRYFIIAVGKDLNGDVSCDTSTLTGLGPDGDLTHPDSAIRYFYTGGKRP